MATDVLFNVVFTGNAGNEPYWKIGDIATVSANKNHDKEFETFLIVDYITQSGADCTYYVSKSDIEFVGCPTPYWGKIQDTQPTKKFTDESLFYYRENLKSLYKSAHDMGKALSPLIFDLLPLVRSGKRVHFLARDCEVLSVIFGDYPNVSTAYGLSRAGTVEPENTLNLVLENGIQAGDIVIDTGFAGSIPRKIDAALRELTGDYTSKNLITSVLLSGDSSSFGKVLTDDSSTRHRILNFEHAAKFTTNEGDNSSTICVLDKTVRRNAFIWRRGFIAGVFGQPLPQKLYRVELYREAMRARVESYRETGLALTRLENRVKYSGMWYVKHNYVGYNTYRHEATRYNGENPDFLPRMWSKKEYATRLANAKNKAVEIREKMARISNDYLFPVGISPTIETIDTTRNYASETMRTDAYLQITTGYYQVKRLIEYFNSEKLYAYLADIGTHEVQFAVDTPIARRVAPYKYTFDFNRVFVSRDNGETFNPVMLSDQYAKTFNS